MKLIDMDEPAAEIVRCNVVRCCFLIEKNISGLCRENNIICEGCKKVTWLNGLFNIYIPVCTMITPYVPLVLRENLEKVGKPRHKKSVGNKIVSARLGRVGQKCRLLAVGPTCRRHVGDFPSQAKCQNSFKV